MTKFVYKPIFISTKKTYKTMHLVSLFNILAVASAYVSVISAIVTLIRKMSWFNSAQIYQNILVQ